MKKELIIFALILWTLGFCLLSCGARNVSKQRTEESSTTALVDKSQIDKTENSETNIKKTSETTINNQDQTITTKEVIEPIDSSKPSSYKDKDGKLQELNNAKKTTEKTVKNNNNKTDLKEKTDQSKKEILAEKSKNDLEINQDSKLKTEDIKIEREAVSMWWWLIPIGVIILVWYAWKNKAKIIAWWA